MDITKFDQIPPHQRIEVSVGARTVVVVAFVLWYPPMTIEAQNWGIQTNGLNHIADRMVLDRFLGNPESARARLETWAECVRRAIVDGEVIPRCESATG